MSSSYDRPRDGDQLSGNFEIVGTLGEGMYGIVLEALDFRLGRRVALKYPLHDSAAQRLVEEGEALAALRHDGLPTVFGLYFHEDIPFLALERVLGLTLERHMEVRRARRHPFTIDEALEILASAADALCAIHGAGLAHRDVKPDNIILSGRRLILVDLGLALPEVRAQEEDAIVGTPAYMAPETVMQTVSRGAAHLADLYAFGVMAYELLTGRLPFDAPSVGRLLEQHVRSPAPKLEHGRLDAPRALSELVHDLMQKRPEDRPPDMEEVRVRLLEIRRQARALKEAPVAVLVVDDDEDMTDLIRVWLDAWLPDAEVVVAEDGEVARDRIAERRFDLVLVDLAMPRMNGIELIMFLQGTRRDDPPEIFCVSGRARDSDRELLRTLGVRRVVEKGDRLEADLYELVRLFQQRQGGRRLGSGAAT